MAAEQHSTDADGVGSRPLILVSNDDGVHASGIAALAEAMGALGEVVVSAPDTERSGASHAMTFHSHLRAKQVKPQWWAVSGTPVDCVYFGMLHLCRGRTPDLVVSGVNHGFNLGTDVFYSGTVGAAAEGRLRGCRAMAVSTDGTADPGLAAHVAARVARKLLAAQAPALLSVNVPVAPALAESDAAAVAAAAHAIPIAVTRLGRRSYQDEVHRREDPHGRPYYWIGGPPTEVSGEPGDDLWAVSQGQASVTPLVLDLTAPELGPTRALLDVPSQDRP